ncbi:hypothetical protein JHK82_044253 [Glycine max]|uniref:Germin-like protein n=1 Tax=Glycine soja TaxID=3848 RepID=A0A445GFD5_GLYSO|nr:germin-like protein 1 [Glycine soja]KAG4938462.1 hypothetical protein JHK86_044603 [Glycine max]KAG4951342.1 hypothetical protein JHK85_045209 [Glycine max]KAG5099201.1 hypothetical protein JHK82_044253 [Glycine max]KHN27554.1 Germin-like protein 1 [Glycine soja]RZB59944.1 Germin-like protein 1 [Glycine soja]
MMMKNKVLILFFSALLSSTSYASNVNDFCVADLKGPDSLSGYPCLPPTTLTDDNFVFNLQPANTSQFPTIKAGISTAFVNEFPALNGLDISVAHVAFEKDGFFPMHSHPDATELIILVEGEITAGFVTGMNSIAYLKTLKPGDLMVIPPGHLHFVANSGNEKATGFATFSSSNPTIHSFNNIFANNIPSDILAQATFLDVAQVKNLKARFGGSN